MTRPFAIFAATVTGASLLAGCSSDGNLINPLTTSAITPTATAVAVPPAPRVDPVCAALATRIDTLRREGVVERAEKAAAGKTTTVQVKRASLAQLAELDKANAEFQARCSVGPKPIQAQAPIAPVTGSIAPAGAPVVNTATVVPVGAPAAKPVAAAPAQAVAPPVVVPKQ